VVSFLAESATVNWFRISLCAVAVAAGTFARPSYAIAALPAVVVCAAYNHIRREAFSRAGLLWGFVLPALTALLWQFLRTYASTDPHKYADPFIYRDSIILAPLAVMRLHSTNLFSKYILSTLFPLSVLLLFGKRAWADHGFRFSCVAFIFGCGYTYALAEKARLAAGNFLWSGYITLFMLNCFAALFVTRQLADTKPPEDHVLSRPAMPRNVCGPTRQRYLRTPDVPPPLENVTQKNAK
jgi:hypothetical protein